MYFKLVGENPFTPGILFFKSWLRFCKIQSISISILLSFNVSSQLLIEVQQVAIGGKERIYDDMNETSTKPYWLRIWGLY